MKFATAVRHLDEMAEVSTENLRLRDSGIGWPLEERAFDPRRPIGDEQ